jgi:hypothetical protein
VEGYSRFLCLSTVPVNTGGIFGSVSKSVIIANKAEMLPKHDVRLHGVMINSVASGSKSPASLL